MRFFVKIEFARRRAGREERNKRKREALSRNPDAPEDGGPKGRMPESLPKQLLETPHVLVRTVAVGGFTSTLTSVVEEKARCAGEVRIGLQYVPKLDPLTVGSCPPKLPPVLLRDHLLGEAIGKECTS